MSASFESVPTEPGVAIDATVAGHIAGDVIDAVAKHDASALDEAVRALNQDLERHDLRIVPRHEVDPRTYTDEDIVRAERIGHLIDMGGVLDDRISTDLKFRLASSIIDAEDLLPARRRGDKHYAAPYDGTPESFDEIRTKDRSHYLHIQSVIRHKKNRR